jgi:TetR/AcrR family transcriptional regulator
MGINERKERERARRREEIIDAAEKVFFSSGISVATMDDVAEAAELSKGTLYLYFKSKEDLYLAINLRGTGILRGMFAEAVAGKSQGLEKVRAIGDAYFAFFKKYPDYFNAMMHYESNNFDISDPEAPAAKCAMEGVETNSLVVEALRIGIADGSIRKDLDVEKTALILWAESTGVFSLISTRGSDLKKLFGLNPDELVDYSHQLKLNSLKAE